jgi:hypothetical protein
VHLTDATYAPLLRSTLPPHAARPLATHLSGGCEACEGWLAARPQADGLDGLVDAALAALAREGGAAGAGHDVEFAGIMTLVLALPR